MILKDLWEIMKVFQSNMFAVLLRELQDCHDSCDEARRRIVDGTFNSTEFKLSGKAKPSELELKRILNDLSALADLCDDVGLNSAHSLVSSIRFHIEGQGEGGSDDAEYSSLTAELRNAIDAVIFDFVKRKFAQIPVEFSGFINNDSMFGPEVNSAFPDAAFDLKEAGNCIAIDSGTAGVFHLMRAVEWSLRGLCAHLGVGRVRRAYKPHKQKYTAIAWAQWERMLEEVQKRIDEKVDKLGPGKKKQELQQFYYPLMQELRGFKEAFRNHVMHSRATYTQKAASDICDHVGRFMKPLAQKLVKSKS
jgi:hypothetical protein